MTEYETSVIIPTLGLAGRSASLDRAIASVLGQKKISALPIVVLNGSRFDQSVLRALNDRSDIKFLKIDTASPVAARLYGRKRISTPFFGFLDDDDELLPDALCTLRDYFIRHPETDVVAGNYLNDIAGVRQPGLRQETLREPDHALALMKEQWLPSGGAMFKASTTNEQFFDIPFDHLEWTCTAILLALSKNIIRVPDRIFIRNIGTVGQMTQSADYARDSIRALEWISQLNLSTHVRNLLQEKICSSLHTASDIEIKLGNSFAAWRYHFKSLVKPGGMKYLTFTRHLLIGHFVTLLQGKRKRSSG